jgi:hypothetical protein
LLARLPVDFPYAAFALVLTLNGIGMGLFVSPNRANVMNSLPPGRRGVGAGMASTFSWSAQVLSIGIFFSLMIIGLAAHLPATLYHGLIAHDVPHSVASHIAHLPPVSSLFATFLGYNPVAHLLGATILSTLPHAQATILTGHDFFPKLITKPFASALSAAFTVALILSLLSAAASLLRGRKYSWSADAPTDGSLTPPRTGATGATPVAQHPREPAASPASGPLDSPDA